MKNRYRMYIRGKHSGSTVWWCQDNVTGKRESLRTNDRSEARRLLDLKNQPQSHAGFHVQMARTHLLVSDPQAVSRTWQMVMDAIVRQKTGATKFRWERAAASKSFDNMGKRFLAWYREELWTPHGKVFDVGVATSRALARIATGMRAEVAGGDDQFSNGNGSLMLIIPVSLRFADDSIKEKLDCVHRASAITHRHPRSQMACGFFTLIVCELLNGHDPSEALAKASGVFRSFYEPDPWWSVELDYFQLLLAGDLARRPESEIDSGGYVLHTLVAALWCLLTTKSFEECVLKAVNLGGDTDTTGCVAGGMAGVHYGFNAIPEKWIHALARRGDVEALFNNFCELTESKL